MNQNKRHFNHDIYQSLCSGMSQRRIARVFRLSRTTVARKLRFLGQQAERKLAQYNLRFAKAETVEFDDLITIEHTKLKPLAMTIAVEHRSRRILGLEVAPIPASGHLAKISRKKYGPRKDGRRQARAKLFSRLKPLILETALIKSDQEPNYERDVLRFFPKANHQRHKGKKSSTAGQGELKLKGFDPLFAINHTLAMFRANINRLFRRTWNTTKDPARLRDHAHLYALYHNQELI